MGQEVDAAALGRERRRAHRERLALCLGALEGMLTEHARGRARFEDDAPRVGCRAGAGAGGPRQQRPAARQRRRAAAHRRCIRPEGSGGLSGPGRVGRVGGLRREAVG
ncbi:MAG: hypothetical protein PGN11_20095, partial [Quadrisphaera sp.]